LNETSPPQIVASGCGRRDVAGRVADRVGDGLSETGCAHHRRPSTGSRTPFVVVINPSVPAENLSEFIAYAKANSGGINFGSPGVGSANHVFVELFKMVTGVDLVHVPYRSSMLPDLLSGQIQLLFAAIPGVIESVRAGKLRALAVTTATRAAVLPDVPAISEIVPGYEASGWLGIGAPKNIPADLVKRLNQEIAAVIADPVAKARLVGLGIEPMSMTPADFQIFMASEVEKWSKVVKFAGIKIPWGGR
jgi:tripartite-type tricarboxylate transporter receptor subunit TctC